MPAQHVDSQKLYVAERAMKAKNLRTYGYSYQMIADELGVSMSTVRDDIKRYMEDIPREQANEYRHHQLDLLDMLLSKWVNKATKSKDALDGVLKINAQRMVLTGTDKYFEEDSGEAVAREDMQQMLEAIWAAAKEDED